MKDAALIFLHYSSFAWQRVFKSVGLEVDLDGALEPKHQNHQRQFWSPSLVVAEGRRSTAAVAAT